MKTVLLAMMAVAGAASAAPVTYEIEPSHTYPSFEADHMGMSLWRGKFNQTTGTVTLDREAAKGDIKVDIDLNSIDFGQEQLNDWARGKDFFDTAQHPQASYSGELSGFRNGAPTMVNGQLTLHGITKPVALKINSFKCQPHPMFKRDWCGADAYATFNREEFGLAAGKDWGFDMNVVLRIQVEAVLPVVASSDASKAKDTLSK
ncbi:MAG TPA: YceI family protein [Lysobacter sp.]|jgi:polyisoprenoid-binding protein YceI|nr:YceI family protein [Lysobacter sp.]